MSIPKIIHQIWIGDPNKEPVDIMGTWVKQHPTWNYMLWTEKEIDALNLINRDKYDYYYERQKYYGCADIVRVEVLYRYGGIYIDADSLCNNSMDDLLHKDFFAVYIPNWEPISKFLYPTHLIHQRIKNRIGNQVIGSTPKHEILKNYITTISALTNLEPAWDTVGGTALTKVLNELNATDKVLPSYSFYTVDMNGKPVEKQGKNYSSHYWKSTYDSY